MGYSVSCTFPDWCGTEHKLGEAGMESKEADGVPGICLYSEAGAEEVGIWSQGIGCGVAPSRLPGLRTCLEGS